MTNPPARFALDHITAIDTTPIRLAELARASGCDAICLFMQPMEVLPLLPQFDLYGSPAERQALVRRMADLGVSVDVAYPFTIAGRTEIAGFTRAMECAAEIGADVLNALLYDRDPVRRVERFEEFCALAGSFGLRTGIEFYPPSQVRSLADALATAEAVGRVGQVGINVDLLHLMRSGGTFAELAAAPAERIFYGQLCDGAAEAPADIEGEASSERLLPGEGVFDLAGFVRALPAGCPLSIEIPRNAAALAGEPVEERVRKAVDGVRAAIGGAGGA